MFMVGFSPRKQNLTLLREMVSISVADLTKSSPQS